MLSGTVREARANSLLSSRLFSWNWCCWYSRCRNKILSKRIERRKNRDHVCELACVRLFLPLIVYHTRTSGLFRFTRRKHMIWLHNNNASHTHTHTHYNAGSTSLSTLFEYMCDRTGCNDIGAANRPIRNTRRPVWPGRRGYGFYVVILHVGTAIWREEKNTFSDKNRKETNSSTARTTAMKQNLLLFSM